MLKDSNRTRLWFKLAEILGEMEGGSRRRYDGNTSVGVLSSFACCL